jgi:hypothetical protein
MTNKVGQSQACLLKLSLTVDDITSRVTINLITLSNYHILLYKFKDPNFPSESQMPSDNYGVAGFITKSMP